MINEKQAHKYCCEPLEKIQNYEAAVNDTTQTWDCHHRGEVLPCGIFSIADLKKFNLYEHRPACELIFLTRAQHRSLHNKADGRIHKITHEQHSKGGKKGGKITGSKNGKIAMSKMTYEQRTKGSKNQPREAKVLGGKISGKKMKGKLYWNNGVINKRSAECPGPNWVRGQLRKKKA